jgi:hypothetical protein
MTPLGYAVTRPLLEAATDAALGLAHLPLPTDVPRIHTKGPDADRVLLIGSAAVAGVGVVSHQLGLGGHLARQISEITGRGVDLKVEGSVTMTIPDAIRVLSDRSLSQFDAIVLVLGSRESIGFQPMQIWESKLQELLDAVCGPCCRSRVFLVATPSGYPYASMPAPLVWRLRRQVDRQNAVSTRVCADVPGVTFLPLATSDEPGVLELGSAVYGEWAESLAPSIACQLVGRSRRTRPVDPVDESARQAALDALLVVGSESDDRIDTIARTARDLLGASGASVTFLDHDRQWIKSAISMSVRDTARASSFCNATISRAEVFVVEDAAADDAFAGHPWVVGEEQVRFYAGYPVEAPNGERVGALCVVDTKPRRFSKSEASLLRELALRVQELVWAG